MTTHPGLPRRLGRYWMLRRLATGGLAEVYLGLHQGPEGFRKPVAVKRLHAHVAEKSHLVRALAEEARLTSQLNHHHIAQVHEFHMEEDEGFLIYEFVPGVTLGEVLRRTDTGEKPKGGPAVQEPVSMEVASTIALGIARALEHAESRLDRQGNPLGLVHRDISPPNVMITFDGVVKVIDFGIAKARDQTERTETGVVKGKFRYMSPEQFAGEDVDIRTDLYALGAVLFELLAGRPLYRADSDLGLMAKVQTAEHPDLRDALPHRPEALYTLMERLLAREVEDRFERASDVVAALRDLQQTLGLQAASEEVLKPLLQQRFPGQGAALNRELAALDAPEGSEPSEPGLAPTKTMTAFEEQATILDTQGGSGWDDSLTDLRDSSQPSVVSGNPAPTLSSMLSLVALGLVMTGATFFLVRGLKRRTPVKPAAAAATVPVRYSLKVACPAGASVEIRSPDLTDGPHPCPFLERLPAGNYELLVQQDGYEPIRRDLNLRDDMRVPRQGTLGMRAVVGTLSLVLEPATATATVNGKPYSEEEPLPPGEHEIIVKAKGFVTLKQAVEIIGGKSRNLTLKLKPRALGRLRVLPPKSGWGHLYHRGRKLCTLPPACRPITLPAGRQTLEYRSVGPPLIRRVTIKAGATVTLDLSR